MSEGYPGFEIKKIEAVRGKESEEGFLSKINPNRITLLRIFLLPLPVALLFLEGYIAKLCSLGLGSLLGVTDYLDGLLARRRKQITPIGALLDPVADKIFVTVLYLTLVYLNYFSFAPVALLLSREIIVAWLRSWFPEAMRVAEIARFKTFFQMSLAGLTIALSLVSIEFLEFINYFLWALAIFSYISAVPYFYRVKRALMRTKIEPLRGAKSLLSLTYNLTLLAIFPFTGAFFWVVPLSLSFYFFRKGLAKSSPLHAQEESLFILLLFIMLSLEWSLKGTLFYSLMPVLFFSLYRDGLKSIKLMWEILTLK